MKGLEGLIGKTIGRYRLERLLGSGGMGVVYLAVHEPLARMVAIKVLHPTLLEGPPRLAFLARFQDEARIVARLHHPHILPVYDFGMEHGLAYLVMRYVPNGSLAECLHPATGGRPLPLQQVAHYLKQAAAALDYVHRQGIVHRDVKPHNLLVDESRLLLSDFGLARLLIPDGQVSPTSAPTLSHPGARLRGTPCYLAPEQGGNTSIDWRADIYALGVTLYEMLVGQVPFPDTGGGPWSVIVKHLLEVPPPLVGQRTDLTAAMEAVVLKALAKDPRQRYHSAGELALAFRRAIAGGRVLALPAKAVQTGQQPSMKKEGTSPHANSADGRICPVCGTVNRATARFCRKDGIRLLPLSITEIPTMHLADDLAAISAAKLEDYIADIPTANLADALLACPTCGLMNRPGATFCSQDGTRLAPLSLADMPTANLAQERAGNEPGAGGPRPHKR